MIRYKLVRSRRKNISVSVSPENEVTVRCPQGASKKVIDDFLESRKSWIDKVISRNESKLSINDAVLKYREVYVEGKRFPLIIASVNKITSFAVYVKSPKNLKALFLSALSDEFNCFVKEITVFTGLCAASFSFRKYKSRWGCCDGNRNITFNFVLLMLPKELQRYVIVHELCHTVYMNHSREFWRLVEKFEPDYKEERKRLKNFDFLTALY